MENSPPSTLEGVRALSKCLLFVCAVGLLFMYIMYLPHEGAACFKPLFGAIVFLAQLSLMADWIVADKNARFTMSLVSFLLGVLMHAVAPLSCDRRQIDEAFTDLAVAMTGLAGVHVICTLAID